MIEKLIDKNISFLIRYISCDENTKEIYKYSLRILYSYLIDVLALMILAIIFNKIIETAIMLIVFAILQVYGGGYHANTKLGCFIIMVIGWFIGIFGISRVISTNYYVSIVIMIISTVLLFVFTPVLNEKHPVGSDVYMRSKKIVRIAVVVIDVLSVLFLVQHWNAIITPLSTVMFLYSVSLFAAIHKLKKRGK